MNFKTIMKEAEIEEYIEKSRFIGYTKPVKTEEEAVEFIESIKKKHRDATHNVPVYLIGANFDIQRYSDDGEPSGTAGVPILSMLKNEGITDIAIVVTRYFGGIKLGTGGLVRAYTSAAKNAIFESDVVEMVSYKIIELDLDYTLHGSVLNFISMNSRYIIKDTEFTEKVLMKICVEEPMLDEFTSKIVDLTNSRCEITVADEVMLPVIDGKIYEANSFEG